ncbi:class I ribonucleotide reductase maintenance protein YfaE [Ferrimonas balearica]|uniref:class I ribonucleotide reductase maintenance protein YfaE n=1 Tax=Ferrimonas balearica TaxID=44012 RepID=UPI001C998DB0|nr:class I ribonucleotide reductase maintenance protein YfaE [Ferrimonas balearica]MBY5991656.1 2Fe-2S iron-sulfur cluster binding domain-containing protein [Ferrimonas balearica]
MAKVRLASGKSLVHRDCEGSLLETLEQEGHYSECRSGYCGACKATLAKGEVRYLQSPMAFLRGQEILPCCCVPEGDIELA